MLGASVVALFDEEDGPAVHISRPGERSTIIGPRGLVQYERLAGSNGRLEVLRAVLPPGAATSDEPWAHPSTECAYVIDGTLTVEIAGVTHEVGTQESITFDARQSHPYRGAGDGPVEYIVSVTPPSP
ncbi:cupin domain-containing protein [Streptomyces sp. BH055]|uniref:cupin domain-containing protein n=1 Tax=Streptomyces sp. BH055 TaxID=3401173 RepID=UPI003BB7671F